MKSFTAVVERCGGGRRDQYQSACSVQNAEADKHFCVHYQRMSQRLSVSLEPCRREKCL